MDSIPGYVVLFRPVEGEWNDTGRTLARLQAAALRIFGDLVPIQAQGHGIRRYAVVVGDVPAILELSVLTGFRHTTYRLTLPEYAQALGIACLQDAAEVAADFADAPPDKTGPRPAEGDLPF